MSEIRDLVESYYNAVYTPQELTEEQIWEEVESWVNSLLEEGHDLSEYTWEEMYESYLNEMGQPGGNTPGGTRPITNTPYQSRFARPRNANTVTSGRGGIQRPQIASLPTNLKTTELSATAAGQRVAGTVGGGNAGASTRSNRPAPVVRPLPAGAPDLKLKVISPAGAKVAPSAAPAAAGAKVAPSAAPAAAGAKVAPSAAPAAKPAGSAMDQWRAANPKLAAAADERDRTRGTSATTNPLMKDMKSSLPAPTSPSPTTAKTGFDLAKKGSDLPKK